MEYLKKHGLLILTLFMLIIKISFFISELGDYNQMIKDVPLIKVMFVENGKSWEYLISTVGYYVLLISICYWNWKTRHRLENYYDYITYYMIFTGIMLLGVLLFIFIQNPILRAAMLCMVLIFAWVSSQR